MKRTGRCPKCESDQVVADARAVDRGHLNYENELSVSTLGKPHSWLFKDRRVSNVSAWVCGECGFVELYADEPLALRPETGIRCLRCQATIPDDFTACPDCGWSWQNEPS